MATHRVLASSKGACACLQGAACSTTALRAVTLLFGVACVPLFYALHRRLHPRTATAGNSLATVSVPRQCSYALQSCQTVRWLICTSIRPVRCLHQLICQLQRVSGTCLLMKAQAGC